MDKQELKYIAQVVREQQEAANDVILTEELLKTAKARLRLIEEKKLPEALEDAGLDSIVTDDGTKVSVKDNVYASIKPENQEAAYKWLAENGADSIIKNTVTISFGKNEMERCKQFMQSLEERDEPVEYEHKESVHTSTLKSFVREQLEAGNLDDTCLDIFGVSVVKQAQVKPKKNI